MVKAQRAIRGDIQLLAGARQQRRQFAEEPTVTVLERMDREEEGDENPNQDGRQTRSRAFAGIVSGDQPVQSGARRVARNWRKSGVALTPGCSSSRASKDVSPNGGYAAAIMVIAP